MKINLNHAYNLADQPCVVTKDEVFYTYKCKSHYYFKDIVVLLLHNGNIKYKVFYDDAIYSLNTGIK